ncbi:MAG: aldehyde dehydrogenase family protein [Gammaproteobacteria bacterium]
MDCLTALTIKDLNDGVSVGKGNWTGDHHENNLIESVNPANEKIIARVRAGSALDFERVVVNASTTFLTWREIPAPKRGELIREIGVKLREKKSELGKLISLEMGKSLQEGEGEVQEMIDMADYAVGLSRMMAGATFQSERPRHRMYEQWHPLGVIGVISAFNFPVAVWAWNAFIAAVCGNTVVWKPSEKTPLCAIAVQHICNDVTNALGYPNVFSLLILNDDKLKEKFVQDKRLPLISFTGSCKAGHIVYQQVAKRMGRALLELGGNNAIIIDETANLNLAIPAVVFGAVGTAGQRCTSTRRLFIHESLMSEVETHLKNAYRQVTIGDPLAPNILMGPLIDKAAVNQYAEAIEKCLQSGGELIYGGKVIQGPGFYVEPTLMRAENHWDIVQQETFGPILYLMPFSDLREAINLQNAVAQGLSSAIFTDSVQSSEYFLSAAGSDCGIANVNIGTSGAEIGGAFGGEKETGGGRESGSDTWKVYMRRQTNTINWGDDLPLAQGIHFNISI